MKRIIKYITLCVFTILLFAKCEVGDFDLQENPNFLIAETADAELLFNEMQILSQNFLSNMINSTDDVMRYRAMTSNYSDAVSVDDLNNEWERYYEILLISRTIEKQAQTNSRFQFHNAVNKLLLGYLTITMVDYNGKIPYYQAANYDEFPNPVLDEGVALYKQVLLDINKAVEDINLATQNIQTDLFYNSDKTKWISFANSLKLRILIQAKNAASDIGVGNIVNEINTLLAGDIINTSDKDFVFRYSAIALPESRHPYFRRAYLSSFSQYMGNTFMNALKNSKSIEDPRIKYYLYRQSSRNPLTSPSTAQPYLACALDPSPEGVCYVGNQYWGLEHGETRTGRGDNLLRTTFGVYPAGGAYDEGRYVSAPSSTNNIGGAGILPLITSFNLKFLAAESALTIGTNGDPLTLLEEAVRGSMNKVLNFTNVTGGATATDVNNYVDEVILNYNNASSNDDKLDVIMTEFYLASFGNSIEAYNGYRRTGFPSLLKAPIGNPNPVFPRSFPYASDEVNRNSSINQKTNTEKVFWDKNPDSFIK